VFKKIAIIALACSLFVVPIRSTNRRTPFRAAEVVKGLGLSVVGLSCCYFAIMAYAAFHGEYRGGRSMQVTTNAAGHDISRSVREWAHHTRDWASVLKNSLGLGLSALSLYLIQKKMSNRDEY